MDTQDYFRDADEIDGAAWHREAQGDNDDAELDWWCIECGTPIEEAGDLCDDCKAVVRAQVAGAAALFGPE